MFKLEDGREHLYQWDLDRRVIVENKNVCEVHFCNRTSECSLVVEPYEDNGIYVANIPNIILQDARPIRVYAYVDDKYTLVEEQFSVKSRTRPDDYTYTETQVKSYEYLENKLTEIEEKGFSEETINKAIDYHFDKHPINIYFKEEDGNVTAYIDTIPEAEEVSY